MAEIFEKAKEDWLWLKFLKGFFDGKNYGKALVFMFCMAVILTIVGAVGYTVKSLFGKTTQTIHTAGGAVDTSTHKSWWSLIDLTFGGQNK